MGLFLSPVGFFEKRLSSPASWSGAIAPLLLLVIGNTMSASIILTRIQGAMAATVTASGEMPLGVVVGLSFVSACFAEAITFWLSTGAIVSLDLFFTGSGRGRRLVEMSALAFWPQTIWGLTGCVVVAVAFHPEPLLVSDSMTTIDVQRSVGDYEDMIESSYFMLTFRLIGAYFAAWVVALQVTALRVVSGFTVGGAWAAGIVLGLVFVALPWAIQRF